jgi:hypothetical protein
MKKLYIFKQSVFVNAFTTVITKQYTEVFSEAIDWRWEMTCGYWGNTPSYYEGFVPYINGVKEDVFVHEMSKSDGAMFFKSILVDDNSYRLYELYLNDFDLKEPAHMHAI